jgi:uncharacterized protein YcbX
MRVVELHVFPVKSMAGFSPPSARVQSWGLEGDRRWMVVTQEGRFLTQREIPAMSQLRPEAAGATLRLHAEGHGTLDARADGPPLEVVIWKDRVQATTCGGEADAWLTEALREPCRLVYLDDPARRPVRAPYRSNGETVAFTDGFPVLLTSLDSLADLNQRLATPIRISRFRGNIVIGGSAPWAEDGWTKIRIGTATFRVVKPCDRCIITTIDQETGERPDKREPLRTLASFRRDPRGVMFGQNLIPTSAGHVATGDRVVVLEAGEPNVALE